MNRSDFYYRQIVTEEELDYVFDDIENAIDNILLTHNMWGIVSGITVTKNLVADLNVLVNIGFAYDENGKWIPISSQQTVDLSDSVPGSDSRYVRLYVEHVVAESDPRTDGNGAALNYRLEDSFDFVIQNGTISATPSKPSVSSDMVLLATILLDAGQTQIFNADISMDWTLDPPDRHEGGPALIHGRRNETDVWFNGTAGIENLGFLSFFEGGTPADHGIDLNGQYIFDTGRIEFRGADGIDDGIEMSGKNIIMSAGELHMEGGSIYTEEGNIYTDGGMIQTTSGSISSGTAGVYCGAVFCTGNVGVDGHVLCDGDVYADYDGGGGGDFKWGLTRSQTYHCSVVDSQFGTNWTIYTGFPDAGARKSYVEAAGSHTEDSVIFPIHAPVGSSITEIRVKTYNTEFGDLEMSVFRYDLNTGNVLIPTDMTLLSGSSIQTITGGSYDVGVEDFGGTPHVVADGYVYGVAVRAIGVGAGVRVYGIEVDYDLDIVVCGVI